MQWGPNISSFQLRSAFINQAVVDHPGGLSVEAGDRCHPEVSADVYFPVDQLWFNRIQSVELVPIRLKIFYDSLKKRIYLGKSFQLHSKVSFECHRGWGVIRAFVGEAAAVRTRVNICVASSGTSKGNYFRGQAWRESWEECKYLFPVNP